MKKVLLIIILLLAFPIIVNAEDEFIIDKYEVSIYIDRKTPKMHIEEKIVTGSEPLYEHTDLRLYRRNDRFVIDTNNTKPNTEFTNSYDLDITHLDATDKDDNPSGFIYVLSKFYSNLFSVKYNNISITISNLDESSVRNIKDYDTDYFNITRNDKYIKYTSKRPYTNDELPNDIVFYKEEIYNFLVPIDTYDVSIGVDYENNELYVEEKIEVGSFEQHDVCEVKMQYKNTDEFDIYPRYSNNFTYHLYLRGEYNSSKKNLYYKLNKIIPTTHRKNIPTIRYNKITITITNLDESSVSNIKEYKNDYFDIEKTDKYIRYTSKKPYTNDELPDDIVFYEKYFNSYVINSDNKLNIEADLEKLILSITKIISIVVIIFCCFFILLKMTHNTDIEVMLKKEKTINWYNMRKNMIKDIVSLPIQLLIVVSFPFMFYFFISKMSGLESNVHLDTYILILIALCFIDGVIYLIKKDNLNRIFKEGKRVDLATFSISEYYHLEKRKYVISTTYKNESGKEIKYKFKGLITSDMDIKKPFMIILNDKNYVIGFYDSKKED